MTLGSGKIEMTVEEIISTIKHSSLPTVVVEGDDDVIVFRRLEEKFCDIGLSVLPAGGRENVLKIYDKKDELLHPENVTFIADRDWWVLDKIPEKYVSDKILFTDGYSLENDVFRDGRLETLMTVDERSIFEIEMMEFMKWYALAFHRFVSGKQQKIETHPNKILDDKCTINYGGTQDEEEYPMDTHNKILENYQKNIRGKSLIALLLRQIAKKGRAVQHREKALLDMVAASGGPLLNKIYDRVGENFGFPV